MRQAYERVGYQVQKDYAYVEVNQRVRQVRPLVAAQALDVLMGAGVEVMPQTVDRLLVGGGLSMVVIVSRYCAFPRYAKGWYVRAKDRRQTDLFLLARLDHSNERVMDYLLLPRPVLEGLHFNVTDRKSRQLGQYRSEAIAGVPGVLPKAISDVHAWQAP